MKYIKLIVFSITIIFSGIFFYYAIYHLFYTKTNKTESSPYIQFKSLIPNSYRIGFSNLEKENYLSKLQIKGKLPSWLQGTLLRTGPAKFHTNNNIWISNWFDGLSMVYSFKFEKDSIKYTNKFLYTNDYSRVKDTNKMNYRGYLSNGPLNLFNKIAQLLSSKYNIFNLMPNTNVNISMLVNKPVALTEIPYPVQFDLDTLQTIGPAIYNDSLPQSFIQTTAHPHYDFETKEQIGYFIKFDKTSSYNIYKIKDGTTKRELIASIPTKHASYMHSFSITKRYAILIAIPLVASLWKLIFTNKGYLNNFNWLPEDLKTTFIVVDRIQSDKSRNKLIGEYKTNPFFMFHTVNAFEKDNSIIIDLINYPTIDILKHAYLDKLLSKQKYHHVTPSIQPRLKRYTINLDNNNISRKTISKEMVEFPQINYKNFNTKYYKFVYVCSKNIYTESPIYCLENLLKINVQNGEHKKWTCKGCYPGEPIFVPNPNGNQEDDGVILSVVLDTTKNLSFILVLDAKNFKEIARADLNEHIPFGLHGLFIQDLQPQ